VAPIVDGLEEQYAGQIAVRRINAAVGDGPAIMRDYRIPGHPTILIFDSEGQEVSRLFGPQPVGVIENTVETVLASSLLRPDLTGFRNHLWDHESFHLEQYLGQRGPLKTCQVLSCTTRLSSNLASNK
jgi:thioredoxin-like negative regulator of GroEL